MALDAAAAIRCSHEVTEIYRDPLAGLRSQVATKSATVADRQGQLPPIVRALLPERLRASLAQPAPAPADVGAEDLASLTEADAVLDRLLAAFDEALALAPKLRECPDTVPDPPHAGLPPPWLLEERAHVVARKALQLAVETMDESAYLVRWGDFSYLTRSRVHDRPVVHLAWFNPHYASPDPIRDDVQLGGWLRFGALVRTSVPAAIGPLEVRPERVHHVVGRALHLASEIELGDAEFDEAFWVKGDAATATLLVAAVRRRLLFLRDRSPVLSIGGGLVELRWFGGLSAGSNELLPPAALDVVLGIRAALEEG
jgi:hypothetical protein